MGVRFSKFFSGLALLSVSFAGLALADERGQCRAQAAVAEQFANQYLAWLARVESAEMSARAWLIGNALASDALLAQFEQLENAAWAADPELGLGADLLLDAQDFPTEGFEFARCDVSTDTVWLRGKQWQDFSVALRLVKQADRWLVDGMGAVNMPAHSSQPEP